MHLHHIYNCVNFADIHLLDLGVEIVKPSSVIMERKGKGMYFYNYNLKFTFV